MPFGFLRGYHPLVAAGGRAKSICGSFSFFVPFGVFRGYLPLVAPGRLAYYNRRPRVGPLLGGGAPNESFGAGQ